MGFVVCQAKAQTRRRIHHCLRPPHRTCHFSSLGRSDSASPLSIDLSSHHRIGASQYLPSPGGHPQRSSLHPRRVAPVSVSLPPHLPGSRSPVSVYSGARKKDRMQTVREGENCSSNGLERGPVPSGSAGASAQMERVAFFPSRGEGIAEHSWQVRRIAAWHE